MTTGRRSWILPAALLVAALAGCGGDEAGSLEDWCEVNELIYASGNLDAEIEAGEPAELREAFAEARALLDEAARVAPEDILADANTVAEAADRLDHVLEGVDYDMAAIEGDGLIDVASIAADREPALGRIEAYNARECGLEPPEGDDQTAGTVEDSGEDSDATSDADTAPDTGTETADGTSGEVASGEQPDSEWCVAAREMTVVADAMDDVDFTDPAAVEAAVTDFVAKYEEIAPIAPPEIAEAVDTNFQAALVLQSALAEVDYDFLIADLSAIGEIEAETDAARDVISAYNETACGIPADDDETEDTDESQFDPFEGSVRDQVIAELVRAGFTEDEAGCFFDHIDFTDPDAGDDTAAIMEMLDTCGIDLARLMELGEALNP